MNNKTRIRLHLSKNLFESLSREILAEAKVNGGGAYTVAVKTPKTGKIKEVNAVADTDKMKSMEEVHAVADTDKMKKMEEKMSSKEKMAKGLYNEDEIGEMQTNVAEEEEALGVGHKFANGIEIKYAVGTKFDTSEMTSGNIPPGIWVITKYQPNGNVEVKCESGKYEGKPALWNIIGLQNFLKNGMKVVSENSQMNEFVEEGQALITALATLLGVGVPLATSIYKDLKNAKTPEAKKQVMQSLGKSVGDAAGTHLQKSQATPSLNELRKQVKK